MHMGRVKPRRRFFNISFSSFSRLFSCLKQPSSACISETGCVGARLTSAWPLRARYTQLASVLLDISNERATAEIPLPPCITCLSAASRNSSV
jgi:hypothetical protein